MFNENYVVKVVFYLIEALFEQACFITEFATVFTTELKEH